MSEKLRIDHATKSDIGTRSEQQDTVCVCSSDSSFFAAAVCDGMGGLDGGAAASRLAAEVFADTVSSRNADESISELLVRCVDTMDEKVFNLKDSDGVRLNAGTTVVSVVIENGNLYWMSVGDSRLYMLRGDEFVQATRDHNYFLSLSEMPDDYVPGEDELAKGNALISFIGMGGVDVLDVSNNPVKLYENDCILITSDGLFKPLSDTVIAEILKSSDDLDLISERFIEECEKRSPSVRDNISFVLMKVRRDAE